MAPPVVALTIGGQAYAVDGDTLDVAGHRIRLFGIDAPERSQPCDRNGKVWACGDWARSVLAAEIADTTISCDLREKDRYGRSVAICHAGGRDVARVMVASGAARAYLRYSDLYAVDEAVAARAMRGIWAARMVAPDVYRHKPTAAAAPGDCQIKGNISPNGRIFHLPGQRDYGATQINQAKGEAYFCSQAEALAAGFRPARR
ncbi:MAG: thermonuclease family protein [Paracoccaceae bacterium]|nr:thermonuclease family protein [Paracoccaceae bacterium]